MPTDESSSKDATVIDDDLVAALGFEPTVRPTDPGDSVLVAADDFDDPGHDGDLDGPDFDDRPLNGSTPMIAADRVGELDRSEAPTGDGSEVVDGSAVDESVNDGAVVHDVEDGTDLGTESESDAAVLDDELPDKELAGSASAGADLDAADLDPSEVDSVEVTGVDTTSDDTVAEETALDETALDETAVGARDEADPDDGAATALIDLTGDDLEIDDSEPAAEQDDLVADATDAFTASTFARTDLDDLDDDPARHDDASVFESADDRTGYDRIDVDDDRAAGDRAAGDDAVDDGTGGDRQHVVAAPAPVLVGADIVAPTETERETVSTGDRSRKRTMLRARKSRRVIRHVDPWSVLTFSVLFHLCFFAAMLLASVLVWRAADAAGTISNAESFIMELGDYETFEIHGDVVFRAAMLIAGMLTLASSVMVVLLTVVFNLISDLIGGIRVTVLEEETVRVPSSASNRNG